MLKINQVFQQRIRNIYAFFGVCPIEIVVHVCLNRYKFYIGFGLPATYKYEYMCNKHVLVWQAQITACGHLIHSRNA